MTTCAITIKNTARYFTITAATIQAISFVLFQNLINTEPRSYITSSTTVSKFYSLNKKSRSFRHYSTLFDLTLVFNLIPTIFKLIIIKLSIINNIIFKYAERG